MFFLLLGACSFGPPTATDRSAVPAVSLPDESYFAGEVRLTTAAGKELPARTYLLSRSVEEQAGRIVERAVTDAVTAVHDTTMVQQVTDDQFTVTYTDDMGVLVGAGRFTEGAPWSWTKWEWSVAYDGGPYVGAVSEASAWIDEAGWHAIQTGKDADGNLLATITVDLLSIARTDWEARVEKLFVERAGAVPSTPSGARTTPSTKQGRR